MIFAGVAELCRTCLDRVWSSFLGPVVFYPLATGCMMPSAAPADALGSIRRGSSTAWPRNWMPSCELLTWDLSLRAHFACQVGAAGSCHGSVCVLNRLQKACSLSMVSGTRSSLLSAATLVELAQRSESLPPGASRVTCHSLT
jgi:hypothetical protein